MKWIFVCIALCLTNLAIAEDAPVAKQWTVDGQTRDALVYYPSATATTQPEGAPVIFIFHGHGGTARAMARRGFHEQWPEAIIVCPQGLPTKTPIDPEGKRPGWQPVVGEDNDRDLKLFDTILDDLRKTQHVDEHRIYVTGHSNGASFTYILWMQRGKELAAIAPVSIRSPALAMAKDLAPLPVLHIAGKQDPLVPFETQIETIKVVRRIDGCEGDGQTSDAGKEIANSETTEFTSPNGPKVIQIVHPGGHEIPKGATDVIVRFFQANAQPAAK